MKTPESPLDLDSLFNTPTETAPDQPVQPVSPAPTSVFGSPVAETPAQVVENRWDGEEILEIPRASPAPDMESPLAIEDLLSATPAQEEILEPYAEYPAPEIGQTAQAGAGEGTYQFDGNSLANEQAVEDVLADVPYVAEEPVAYSDASVVEAPPAASIPPKPSVFDQDSYVRHPSNTYVMAQPDRSNKGRLAKVFLAIALLFALLGVGYFALSGLVKDWLGARRQVASTAPVPSATTAATTASTSSTTTTASGNASNKTASASPSATVAASPTASVSTKPSPSPSATATPSSASSTANQSAANKPTPTPAPTTGSSGHAVGAGDGSLAIQLASYKSSGEAQRTVARLKSSGVEARIVKAEVAGKGTWFRVQAGRFTNETEASKYAGDLRAKGVTRDFIVTGYQNQ